MRKRLPKFAGNNAITYEDHLRSFLDMMSDYEIEAKDVMMKLFVNEGNKREDHKIASGKRQESSEMNQILNAIKNLSLPQVKNDRDPIDNIIHY